MAGRRLPAWRAGSQRTNAILVALALAIAVTIASEAFRSKEDGRTGAASPGNPSRKPGRNVLTIAWAAKPASLDPAFATDSTSANVVLNAMDPLVKLDEDLDPVPSLAKGWDVSADGRRVTFFLREDGRWTNGDPVTARDYEYAWKRTLSPALRSDYARDLFGIRGAAEYNACRGPSCDRLADSVGVTAVDEHTLVVELTSPEPWFVAKTAEQAFLPVHEQTVERFGDDWTAPQHIVTNGPFLVAAVDDNSITLAKNPDWRNADDVALDRVAGRIIGDDVTRVQAFDAGDVMVLDGSGLPSADLPALREREEYDVYPALETYAYAFNLASIPDVHQRRAMSLAIDRRAILDNVVQADDMPATGLTPQASPGFDEVNPDSPWLPGGGDLGAAKAELARARGVKKSITLLHVDAPGNRQIATALRDAWRKLGIQTSVKARAQDEYLTFAGPLSSDSVDVFQFDWRYRAPDPIDGLAAWRCGSDVNKTNFCDAAFDAVVERARRQSDAVVRYLLYARAEQILFGADGALPVMPIYWQTFQNLESLKVKESFRINPLGQIDLSAVVRR